MSRLQAGSLLSHYRIEGVLGEGGMGEVYRAVDTKLDRTVAIKLLPSSAALDQEARRRLLLEARSAATLNHPHVVAIYSVDEADGHDFIVMEHVGGETLEARVRRRALDLPEFVDLGAQIADALAAAHALALVHRDVKPANIMVTNESQVKVLDFGLAKKVVAEPDPSASTTTVLQGTMPGLIVGTVAYMSPEQTRGEALDARSDIFSLGSTLYEAVTARAPFRGASILETMNAISTAQPEPPSRLRPELPPDVDLILARAMAKDRNDRYQSARDVAEALRGIHWEPEPASRGVGVPNGAASGGPHNLPNQLTSFIGRRRERAEVRRLFATGRMVTVTGPAGCGKTRLALQIGADLLPECPDGAWLVELAMLDDPSLVPQSVARVVGVKESPGQALLTSLSEHLAQKRLLVVLDNCEHVAVAVASLAEGLLRGCPHLRILATSREALGFRGERVWRVPTLSVPDLRTSAARTKEAAERYEAVRLFVDRAASVQPSFALTDKTAGIVAQVCHRLDGIPLAIELAAVRVKTLPLASLLERLEDRFQLLTGGSRTALPRHQTLRAAVDWSYDHLASREQIALTRLSVFAGWFTLEAASEVCQGDEIVEADVLDLLTALVDKSLVVPEEGDDGAGRFRLLETIRAYGAEKLREAGAALSVSERHGSHYLRLAETAEPRLRGPDQAIWFNRLESEHDNLRVAIRGFMERIEPDQALRTVGALWRFWWVRGFWEEGRKRLGEALMMSVANGRTASRAKALYGAAVLARGQGDLGAGKSCLEESLAISRGLGDKSGEASALFELGNIANEHEDLESAKALYQESLRLRRELDDKSGVSYALHNLGVIAHAQGDASAARRIYQEALALHRKLGNLYLEANSLDGLGDVALYQGDLAAARQYQERSLAIHRDLGDRRGIAVSLRVLGRVAVREGAYAKGRPLLMESLEILLEIGDREGLADAFESLVELAAAAGDAEHALRLAGAAAAHRRAINVPLSRPDAEQLERSLSLARSALGPGEAERAILAGWEMSPQEALAEVTALA